MNVLFRWQLQSPNAIPVACNCHMAYVLFSMLYFQSLLPGIIIIIIKNECRSNIIVNRLQGCGHSKKLQGKWKWVTQQ